MDYKRKKILKKPTSQNLYIYIYIYMHIPIRESLTLKTTNHL